MQDRTTELKARIRTTAERIANWQDKMIVMRVRTDEATASRIANPDLLENARAMAQAVSEETDRFYYFVRTSADLAGVREGQFNGVGIMLERLSVTCGRIIVDLESIRESEAA